MPYEPLLEVLRGGRVESIHHGAVAVADPAGHLRAWAGDGEAVTYLRSSAKPFQALPLIEEGAAEALGLSTDQLAVVCASHTGTPRHIDVVQSIQRAAGIDESELQCGSHFPFDAAEAKRLREAGEAPGPNHNNCSGKHTGMLALARHLGTPTADYLDPEHPVQRRIRAALAEMSGLGQDEIGMGVDGCSAPNYAMPLRAAATAFARLADPARLPGVRRQACRQIFEAMAGRPSLVAGPGAFDTRLIEAGEGRWIAKGGAEGFHAVGMRPGALGPGSPALGVAIKIADGDAARRALTPVVLAVLAALGVTWPEDSPLLREFGPRAIRNLREREVGETRPVVRLRQA